MSICLLLVKGLGWFETNGGVGTDDIGYDATLWDENEEWQGGDGLLFSWLFLFFYYSIPRMSVNLFAYLTPLLGISKSRCANSRSTRSSRSVTSVRGHECYDDAEKTL